MKHTMVIYKELTERCRRPYRIVEHVITIDGVRSRLTCNSFVTLEEAEDFIKDNQ